MTFWYRGRAHISDSRVISTCRHCKEEFTQPKCRAFRDKFCSPACGSGYRRARLLERVRKCVVCGGEFTPRPYQLSVGQGKFCSQKCHRSVQLAYINTPQAHAKAAATRKLRVADGSVVLAAGDKHPRWLGGTEVCRQRRRDDGREAKALRTYRAKNPDKVAEWGQSRRSAKIGRVPRGTVAFLLKQQQGKCGYCAREIPPYHLEHKLPVCRGGTNDPANLQLTCPSCNLRKSDLTHEEFLVSKRRRVRSVA